MNTLKPYKIFLVLVLIAIVSVFSFFSRMYRNDINALEHFVASYEQFNTAISNFSQNKTITEEAQADDALIELSTAASFRLSSLIKNEKQVMILAREIADLSAKEFESLKVYTNTEKSNTDRNRLAQEYSALTEKRKAAYRAFRSLGSE